MVLMLLATLAVAGLVMMLMMVGVREQDHKGTVGVGLVVDGRKSDRAIPAIGSEFQRLLSDAVGMGPDRSG